MSVNLSSYQFRRKNLLDTIRQALDRSGCSPEYLELEITESAIMQNGESTISILRQLKNIGLRLAIDDFGTGYSSLSYLKQFPVDALKIDRSFIKGIPEDPEDSAITKAIIAMAHSLDLRVVAEGVETEQQLQFLLRNGCDEMQGYLFSRPTTDETIETFLQEEKCLFGPDLFHIRVASGRI
jgi:EAL domain-containing protein (putative c-di-GMP-specific phosphodiesterase class I)